MSFRVPSAEKQLSQTNSSEVVGNIYQTRNIDFDEEGFIKLSSPAVSLYTETDDADFDSLHSLFHGSSVYFVGGDLFRRSNIDLTSGFTNVTATDTTPPSPGAENDGTYFNGAEVVSDGSTIKYNNGGTWTTISGTPTGSAGNPTALEVFPAQNSLLVGRGNQVARVNTSWTVAVTLTLPADYVVLSIAVNGNFAYIGTRHKENGEAMLFLWTGINTTNDGSYGAGTYGIPAVRKYQSTVAVIDTLGRLMALSGSGFVELASLPVYFTRADWGDAGNDYANIFNRGMVVDGDLIYLNISTAVEQVNSSLIPNQIGGLWCYDPKVGLYQRNSFTNNTVATDNVDSAAINTTTDVITVSGIVVPATGSPVFYSDGGTVIGGLTDGRWYYTIKVTDTTFKVAETYRDAINDTAINLTSASNNNTFSFIDQKDYGQGIESSSGAIIVLNNTEYNSNQLGRIGFTGRVYNTTGSNSWHYMQTCPIVRNNGYVVLPKMFSENPKDTYPGIIVRHKPLDYGDKIKVKYRIKEKVGLPALSRSQNIGDAAVTWSSTTTFTTIASPFQHTYDFSSVEAGDEVEIIGGAGSGFIAHVSSISKSGFQYTITLDEANPFVATSDVSYIKIDNWKLLETLTESTENGKVIPVADSGAWIQYKICLEGVDVTIYDIIIPSKVYEGAR